MKWSDCANSNNNQMIWKIAECRWGRIQNNKNSRELFKSSWRGRGLGKKNKDWKSNCFYDDRHNRIKSCDDKKMLLEVARGFHCWRCHSCSTISPPPQLLMLQIQFRQTMKTFFATRWNWILIGYNFFSMPKQLKRKSGERTINKTFSH